MIKENDQRERSKRDEIEMRLRGEEKFDEREKEILCREDKK
jgi:hypothetical protein